MINRYILFPIFNFIYWVVFLFKKPPKKELPYDGPMPPRHWDCRCYIVGMEIIGIEPIEFPPIEEY